MSTMYDAYYYSHECGREYRRDDFWLTFFGSMADRIAREIAPKTVLDAGCAMGFLVETLRRRGVEAFGLDISQYAIEKAHPDIKPHCQVASVTDPLPQRYDLIICIEVLEHTVPRDAETAIQNFCRSTDDILFSSTPIDYKEATHVNVQPPEYWARLFAAHGFFRDIDYDASFILPWAVRFRKSLEPIPSTVGSYERRLWRMEQERTALREHVVEQRNKLAESEEARTNTASLMERIASDESRQRGLEEANSRLQEANARLQEANARLQEANARLGQDFTGAREILSRIYGSRGWRALQLYYGARDKVLRRESTSVRGKEAGGRDASVGRVGSIESGRSLQRTDWIARTRRPKILLVSGDILPLEGQATTGAGLRIWGLGEGLRSRGYETTYAMPRDVAFKCNYKSDEIRLFDGPTLDSLVREVDPDVLVFQHWPWVGSLTEHPRGHIVVDFHGPLLMETLFREPMDVERLIGWKLKALSMADYFICAGKKQSYYYLAWLLAAGVDVRKSPIATVPFCLSPDLPTHVAWPEDPVFVYGGVFLPWQDPAVGLHVLIEELDRAGLGSLHFFGGSHPWMELPSDRFINLRRELQKSKRVQLYPRKAREELVRRYCEANVAWDLMARNPEREMAFTSRTVEYLWCGLPVVYNNYAELSEYIGEYDAGWLVDPVDEAQIRQTIREILNFPEVVRRKGRNAQRLVAERLTWDRAIAPLDMYCQSPYRAERIAERPLLTKLDGDATLVVSPEVMKAIIRAKAFIPSRARRFLKRLL